MFHNWSTKLLFNWNLQVFGQITTKISKNTPNIMFPFINGKMKKIP